MNINLIYNRKTANYLEILSKIENKLISKNIKFQSLELDKMNQSGDFTIVIGGDGTLLKAARFYSEYQIPVLGINIGRLGFLSQGNYNEIDLILEALNNGEYYTEERMMLTSMNKFALNDFVIKGCDSSRTSKFYLEINGETLCDYIADGLIISTPTGSTAYGLSAGGPVVYPTMDAIVIVPICPHTLNARPLVVPSTEEIKIKTADELLSVSIDGYETIQCVDKITIKSASKKAVLAFLNKGRFYNILRTKLHWGLSPKAY